jgi:glycosyltransferase involved in cell wall biosynthesis
MGMKKPSLLPDANMEHLMPEKPSISVFFPAYNDGGTIGSMVTEAIATLKRLTDDYEVIVVNDGSSDNTQEVLGELEQVYPQLRVIGHTKNRGYGGALRSGFAAANKDLIFYTDGDAQYDVRELASLLEALDSDVDWVNGYKIARSDTWYRLVIGRVYQHVVRFMFDLEVQDPDCDFRLIRSEVFKHVQLESNSGVICVEMMRKLQVAGFAVAEVPVHHYHRTYGRSQFFNFRRIAHVGGSLLRLWWQLVVLPKVKVRETLPERQ